MGLLIYGSEGWMHLGDGWATYFGRKNEPGEHRSTKEEGATAKGGKKAENEDAPHFANFVACVRSRKQEDLNTDILEGHLSTSMCHLSNIAYRTGREVTFDSANENFPGDAEANSYLTREYRYPFVVPEKI